MNNETKLISILIILLAVSFITVDILRPSVVSEDPLLIEYKGVVYRTEAVK